MERIDKFSSVFWLCLGLAIIYSGCKLGLGKLTNPGGGLFLFFLGICLSLLALGFFIYSHRREKKNSQSVLSPWVGLNWKLPIYILISLLIYILIIIKLGYLLSTAFLMAILFSLYERPKWKFIIFATISTTFLSYLLFGKWLQVQFPRGVFESLIGR